MVKTDLSLIILSFNTELLLRNCLEAVFRAVKTAGNQRIEVIVVDNASKDNSPYLVRRQFPEAVLVISKKNVGFSRGNNLGLKKAKGRYILFLNSDTEIYPNSLRKMIEFMDKDETIGAVTPKTLLTSGKMDPDCHRGFPTPWASLTFFLGLERLFPKSHFFGQYHKLYQDLDQVHEIDAGFGTFMLVRRDVINQVGTWDESYFFYGEDLDFFYRIKEAGWRVMFYAEPLLRHHKGASSGLRNESKAISRADRRTRLRSAEASIRAMEIFYKKFYQDKYPDWMTSLVLVGIRAKGYLRLTSHYLKL
ncbi:MAG TPA: glycosyltransferase family 2 protein [Candidatus Bathyarchaeia archaeon]|nr:glycosyltransferase family 2 protein [Candidatus Bathyarchaeia archaeon]